MQVRDVMTRDVHTVGPETSAKYAAEVLAERGSRPYPWSTATTSWSASSRRPISCAIGCPPIPGCTSAGTRRPRRTRPPCSSAVP